MRVFLPGLCHPLLHLLLAVALAAIPVAALSAERTALVIGNGAYRDAPSLRNPVNDATDIARVLDEQLGFEVILRTDVTQQQFDAAVRDFRKRVQRHGGVALFYYAGHGIQVDGHNYLIPVNADIDSETDVRYKAVDAGYVLGQMDEADAALNIVILDACRDNPFERGFRSASRGLARLDMPAGELGSLLAYSTAPGEVAADGTGRNSPYTSGLLDVLTTPGLTLEQVFKQVTIAVYERTEQRQKPWTSQFLLGDFYFLAEQQTATASDEFHEHALTVTVDPPDAEVQIPDSNRTYSPGMMLPPGSYRIRVSKPGFEAQEQLIRIGSEDLQLRVALKAVAQPAKLTVRSNVYEDRVYIDDQYRGSTRLDLELQPGWHTVRIEKDGYDAFSERIELRSGEHRSVAAQMISRTSIPTEAQLRSRGLRPLSDNELQDLYAGYTHYYEDLRSGSVVPVFFAQTGKVMAEGEHFFEGRYWVIDQELCIDYLPSGDVCASVFRDGDIYRACDSGEAGLCAWAINRIEADNVAGLHRPGEAELRQRGVSQLSGAEILELMAGNTVYLEDPENSSVIPMYYLHSGRRRLQFEERFFEGDYWISNDALCVESVYGGDVCTPIFENGHIYRVCHPNPEVGCRLFFDRIEPGNAEDLRPE